MIRASKKLLPHLDQNNSEVLLSLAVRRCVWRYVNARLNSIEESPGVAGTPIPAT